MSIPGTFQLEAFQDAVYSWVKNAMDGKIPADRIIWRDQGAPIPRRPCVTLKVTDGPIDVARSGSRVPEQIPDQAHPGQTIATGRMITGVQAEATVSVQIFGNIKTEPKLNAGQAALDLNSSLMLMQHQIPLRRAGVSVQDRGSPTNISALEESQFEERYQFDVKFGVSRNVFDDVGVIENVNGEGTVGEKTAPIHVTST